MHSNTGCADFQCTPTPALPPLKRAAARQRPRHLTAHLALDAPLQGTMNWDPNVMRRAIKDKKDNPRETYVLVNCSQGHQLQEKQGGQELFFRG